MRDARSFVVPREIDSMQVILFPGQGAQTVGMGRDLCERSAAARSVFERADEALGFALSKTCFEGPEDALAETDVCQPAILTCSAAYVAAMEEAGVLQRDAFAACAGLSLGEYTALWFAGSLDFEDAVRLVRVRGRGMQDASDAVPSGMTSLIGGDEAAAKALCEACAEGDVLVPANFLAPGNLAVSGAKPALERVASQAKAGGFRRAIPLKVAGAFHSPLMEPAVRALEEALESIELGVPRLPVISNVTGQPHAGLDGLRADLLKQVTSPVRWEASMRYLIGQGVTTMVEPGPGSVLSGLMRKIDKGVTSMQVGTIEELDAYVQSRAASGGAGA